VAPWPRKYVGGGGGYRRRSADVGEEREAGIPAGLRVGRGATAAETGGGAAASSAAVVAKMGSLTASI